jgi:hypothetical protein
MIEIKVDVDNLSRDESVTEEAYEIIRTLDKRGYSKYLIEDITAFAAYLAGQD